MCRIEWKLPLGSPLRICCVYQSKLCNLVVSNTFCLYCKRIYRMSKHRGFAGGTSGKEHACQCRRQEMWVWSLSGKTPLEEGRAAHSSILAWRIPWTEEPGGLQSRVAKSQTRLSDLAHTHVKTKDLENWWDWITRYGNGRGSGQMEFQLKKGQSRILLLALLLPDTDNTRSHFFLGWFFQVSPVSLAHPLKNQSWWDQMTSQVGTLPVKE